MLSDEWPRVRDLLDRAQPALLGLVLNGGDDSRDLGHHNQVLAYGYDLAETSLTLWLYDPDWPADDAVSLSVDIGNPNGLAVPTYSRRGAAVLSFFNTRYAPRDPTPWSDTLPEIDDTVPD